MSNGRHTGRCIVIGAGIAGLAAARALAHGGYRVQVVDKGRGPGGRASTRREGELRFDHGAQYFTARDPRFREQLEAWMTSGHVARWEAAIGIAEKGHIRPAKPGTTRYVGVPGMNMLAKTLAEGLDVRYGCRVERIERRGSEWMLFGADDDLLTRADTLLVTAPPPQAAVLIGGVAPGIASTLQDIRMRPSQAVMVTFNERLPVAEDGLFVHDSPLTWAARNSSKPGRPSGEAWVLHGALEEDLLAAFERATGLQLPEPTFHKTHRWMYALAENPLVDTCLCSADNALAVFGDWSHGSRVEGAYLSGLAAARRHANRAGVTTPGQKR